MDQDRSRWPRCPACKQPMGMYTPPAPAAPAGALQHYCSVAGRDVVTYPETDEQHAFVGASVAVSRANREAMREEFRAALVSELSVLPEEPAP